MSTGQVYLDYAMKRIERSEIMNTAMYNYIVNKWCAKAKSCGSQFIGGNRRDYGGFASLAASCK